MLKPIQFANSFAAAAAIVYTALYLLKLLAEPLFRLILNSQLFGADVAAQVPSLSVFNFLGILIAVALVNWLFGYLIACLYNKFNK